MLEKRKKPEQKSSSSRAQKSKSSSRQNISKKQIYDGCVTNIMQTNIELSSNQPRNSKNITSLKSSKVSKLQKAKSQNLSKEKKISISKNQYNPYINNYQKSQRQIGCKKSKNSIFGIGANSLSTGNSKIFKRSLDKNKQALLDCLIANDNTILHQQKKKKYSDSNLRVKKSKVLQYQAFETQIVNYDQYLTQGIRQIKPADVKWIKRSKSKDGIFFGTSAAEDKKKKKRSKQKQIQNQMISRLNVLNSQQARSSLKSHQKHSNQINRQKSRNRHKLDEKPIWDQKKIPYDWKTVFNTYRHYLTKHEMSQIKQYSKIFYIGHRAKKKEKIDYYNNATDQVQISNMMSNLDEIHQFKADKISKIIEEQPNPFDTNDNEYAYIVNDHIAYRYEILSEIGKGSYGQVFKVFDHKRKQQMALKMIKNKQKFTKQAFIQIKILTYIKQHDSQGISHIVRIKDFIIFRKHVCIVFEMLSQNLYELIIRNNYNGLDIQLIRRFAIQILSCLCFLQKHKIIHCDLKPENILLKQYSKSGLKIIDFGSSCFQNQILYTYIQSRYYRAPQITLGLSYGTSIDVWSVGCILGQLYTGVPLFPGQEERDQMKYMVDTLGVPPNKVLQNSSRASVFFDMQKGQLNYKFSLKQQIKAMTSIDHFSKKLQERIPNERFRNFVKKFLTWDSQSRITPQEALKDQWIMQGLPQQLRNVNLHQIQRAKNNSSAQNSNLNNPNSKKVRKSSANKLKSQSCDTKNRDSHGRISLKKKI